MQGSYYVICKLYLMHYLNQLVGSSKFKFVVLLYKMILNILNVTDNKKKMLEFKTDALLTCNFLYYILENKLKCAITDIGGQCTTLYH